MIAEKTRTSTTMPKLWVAAGRSYQPREEKGRGGEGYIYDFGSGLAKVYRPSVLGDLGRISELREKVDYLTKLTPLQRDLRFGAPMMSVFADPGCHRWAGFAMRRCPGVTMHAMGSLVGLERHLPGWDRLHVTRAASSLVGALATLESHGILVADINPGNFLVDPGSGRVSCIDCDSYQVSTGSRVFASHVFTPRYASVEVLEATTPRPRTLGQYHYSCGILLFEVLTHGLHPHAVRWGDDPVSNIRAGKTFIGGKGRASGGLDPELFQHYNLLCPAVKHICVRTFVEGHSQPHLRPTLADWQWALREQVRALEST